MIYHFISNLYNPIVPVLLYQLPHSRFLLLYNIENLQAAQECMKLMSSIFKDDPFQKQLKKMGLLTDSLGVEVIESTLKLFQGKAKQNLEEAFLKVIIKQLQEKTSYARKVKIMSSLIQIAKISKYDVCDIILNKKIKTFSKPSKHKHNELEPKPQKLQQFIHEELLIPMYNYLMKMSTNQELYHTCKQGDIPYDDVFRRGTKIRFIWIFKLYNIINILIPIVHSLEKAHKFNPDCVFFAQNITFLFNDLVMMNNFVVKALEEASTDNFMLMPYFDMLQFYESLKEQLQVGKSVLQLFEGVRHVSKGLIEPSKLTLKQQQIDQIEIQALRVKLISNSLKNPKKDHKRLETQYQQKIEKKQRRTLITEPNGFINEQQEFADKWRHLD